MRITAGRWGYIWLGLLGSDRSSLYGPDHGTLGYTGALGKWISLLQGMLAHV